MFNAAMSFIGEPQLKLNLFTCRSNNSRADSASELNRRFFEAQKCAAALRQSALWNFVLTSSRQP
jgi:hypothetical protein